MFVLLTRLFLGYTFYSSGMCKLSGGRFGQLIGPCHLEELLRPYNLEGFALLIAASQVVVGTLLLSQRYALLGSVMLLPMNVGILGVTLSQSWAGTPYINAVLLLLNLALVLYDFPKLRFFIQPEFRHTHTTQLDALAFQWRLPAAALGVAALGLVVAPLYPPLALLLGLLTLSLAYLNVWVYLPEALTQRGLVGLSFVAVVAATLAYVVPEVGFLIFVNALALLLLWLLDLALSLRTVGRPRVDR